jgi:hypothetical protein
MEPINPVSMKCCIFCRNRTIITVTNYIKVFIYFYKPADDPLWSKHAAFYENNFVTFIIKCLVYNVFLTRVIKFFAFIRNFMATNSVESFNALDHEINLNSV